MRLLFDRFGADRLILCLDPHAVEIVADFARDRAGLRLLEVDCRMDARFLAGHARRVGLIGASAPPATVAALGRTMQVELEAEAETLRGLRLPGYYRIREGAPGAENCVNLAAFLGIPTDMADEILSAGDLFAD